MLDPSERLLVLLKSVYDSMHNVARSTWREYGLPPPGALVMRQIDRHPGVTVSALARSTGLAKSNVSKTVDGLVETGFIRRCSDPKDRRLGRLYATAKAEAHFHEMWSEMRKRLSLVLATLSHEETEAITGALQTLKEAVDKGIEQPLRSR